MPHCLVPKGQGTPQQDGMPGSDHPCRQAHAHGVLHHLCSEGKWQAMPVLGSLWPQWAHLLRSSQDVNCGVSHSQVCTLLLLHQVGCPPWILVYHPRPSLQLPYDFQQSFWKIPFPAPSLWPHLLPRHLPEEDGSDPCRVPRMYWNCRWHHHPQLHWGRTQYLPMKPHVDHPQIWFNPQKHMWRLKPSTSSATSMMLMVSTQAQERLMLYTPYWHQQMSQNSKSS